MVTSLAQVFINALELGLIYALVALGFSLIYGVGSVIFCTHGEVYMVGAMSSYFLTTKLGLPFPLVLISVGLGTGVFGLLIERFLFRRLRGNDFAIFVVSLALAMVILNLFSEIFGTEPVRANELFSGYIAPMGVNLSLDKMIVALISVGLILGLHVFFQRVKVGQSMRAVAQDPEAAALQGISINKTVSLTFFLSLSLAGVAGVLVAPVFIINTGMGTSALMNTFVVVILGGIGSFPGAIAGGLFLGILHVVGGLFIGKFTFLLSFVAVIIFLVVRPQGFFGHE
ncbi:MAG: branched-chain amino acid ABC transporter permease [Dehalococcoidia bacterium]|jgi:branched-chain amino acid transport system permease protein